MSYTKYVYNRVNWKNKSESLETPLGKANLNRMDSAIYNIAENLDIAYNELDAKKFNEANASKVLSQMPTWDGDTGILTLKFYDGTTFQIDFNIEKIPVKFSMDSTGLITMETADGTKWTANIADVIPDYIYEDTDTIAFTDKNGTPDEKGHYAHTISAEIKANSITEKHLETDYLTNIITNAKAAAASAESAATSESNAAYDAKLSQSYAIGGSEVRDGEDTDNSKYYSQQSSDSATESKSYAIGGTGTRTGEDTDNSRHYSQQAASSASSASKSESNASSSASTASTKASDASTSASNAKTSETNAKTSETNAKTSETNAKTSETNASGSATSASGFATSASESADGAKKYYEQCKDISDSFSGALRPMGTVTFANLPSVSSASEGDMYNVSNEFTTTTDFKEGSGYTQPAGTNVYKTADGKWDCLAGTPVTGVKGNSESSYRRGNVNITAANIGLGNVGNFKAVSTVASQGLTDTEKSNARTNIGAGTSSFSGSYNDLTNKPTVATQSANGLMSSTDKKTLDDVSTTYQKIDTTYPKTYSITGANGSAMWYCLGTLTSNGDSSNAVIDVYTGDGYNGGAYQNSYFRIIIKDGWQSSVSVSAACGVTVYSYFASNIKVKVIATAHNVYVIWAYFPWDYWNGNFTVQGNYYKFVHSNTNQSNEPTDGTAQSINYNYMMTSSSTLDATKLSGTISADRLPTASTTLGAVKTTSTVTSNSGYTACPIIGGVPYYKDTNTTYTLAGLMGSSAIGSSTQPVYWTGSKWANATQTSVSGSSGSCTGNAATASKLGTSTVGGTTSPIYLNSGTATACTGRTVPGIKSASAVTDLGWGTNNSYVSDITLLAYWNGAYSGTSSNLQYCSQGKFGTIITKGSGDYLPISGGTLTGKLTTSELVLPTTASSSNYGIWITT
jgi:hypothetical protein